MQSKNKFNEPANCFNKLLIVYEIRYQIHNLQNLQNKNLVLLKKMPWSDLVSVYVSLPHKNNELFDIGTYCEDAFSPN